MAATPRPNAADHASSVFADIRQHNERRRGVARVLASKRKRQVEQAIRAQRHFRIHQSR